MASRPRPDVGFPAHVLDQLLDAPDPATRARLLVDAALLLLDARGVALCRPLASGWARLVTAGEDDELPSSDQVEAVVAGDLGPDLPHRCAVLVGAADLALALSEVDPEDEAYDTVGGILTAYAILSAADAAGGLDEVQGAAG